MRLLYRIGYLPISGQFGIDRVTEYYTKLINVIYWRDFELNVFDGFTGNEL